MLTKDELISEISQTIAKAKVIKLTAILEKQSFSLHDLIDITFHEDKNIAFRAAWLLENMFLRNPEIYIEELKYLIQKFRNVTNPSCKRHYVKILMHIITPKANAAIQQRLAGIDLEPIAEQLFDWIIDPKVLIAVKVFAAQTLFNLRYRYPWIKEELAEQLKFLMRSGTAAIQSRGKKLLAEL
jgi:hypothetical protein